MSDPGFVGISLALFGYPISAEFEDPDTGLITQYFKRVRFEYHPDNPTEHQVLLGHLGVELLDQRDWYSRLPEATTMLRGEEAVMAWGTRGSASASQAIQIRTPLW